MNPGDGPGGAVAPPFGPTRVFGPAADPLGAFLAPRGVAVFGAGDGLTGLGSRALANLLVHPGRAAVYPIHPTAREVGGVAAYPTLGVVPGPVDLAVIAGGGDDLTGALAECAARGVGAAIALDPGLHRVGDDAAGRRTAALDAARDGRVRLMGPGALGLIRPGARFDASVAEATPRVGPLAFFGEDAAITAAALDWAARAGVGFSVVGAIGEPSDVGWADLIDSLGADPVTQAIVLALASLGDAHAALASARSVAGRTPIVLVRPGGVEPSPASGPGGAGPGADAIFETACRRAGVALVDGVADAFPLADALTRFVRPRAGPVVIVADAPEVADLARLGPPDTAGVAIAPVVPSDVLDPASWADAVARSGATPGSGGVLVIRSAGAGVDPVGLASALARLDRSDLTPVLASLIGVEGSCPAGAVLRDSGIPTFSFPDTAARAFAALARLADRPDEDEPSAELRPDKGAGEGEADAAEARRAEAGAILDRVAAEGRSTLDEIESKAVLAGWGLEMVRTRAAMTEDEAVDAAECLGFPVALKLYSRTVAARTEVGGIRLDLGDPHAVRGAFWGIEATVGVIEGPGRMLGVTVEPMLPPGGVEVAVRARLDPNFGPVIELAGDKRDAPRAVDLPPLTTAAARRLVDRSGLLADPTLDRDGLAEFLAGLGQLLVERPRIAAVDLAPVRVSTTGAVALDARVTLHRAEVADDDLPRPCFPPEPDGLASPWTARDGGPAAIRLARPGDAPRIARLATEAGLAISPDWVERFARSDQARQVALVVEYREPWTDLRLILGLARLTCLGASGEAEVALLIGPTHRGRGFGTELLRRLLAHAQRRGLRRVVAHLDRANQAARHVVAKFGGRLDPGAGPDLLRATLDLAHLIEPDPDPDHSAPSERSDLLDPGTPGPAANTPQAPAPGESTPGTA